MTTVDDLRATFEEHALDAPGGDAGLIAGARDEAARIRRRRLAMVATGMAALIAVAAVVVPLSLHRDAPQAPAADGKAVAGRKLGQVTLGINPKSDLGVGPVRTQDHLQRIYVFAKNCHGNNMVGCAANSRLKNAGALVYAFDPGSYDATLLQRGEPMTVAGHPAWYQPKYRLQIGVDGRTNKPAFEDHSVVGWQDRSGVWVLVVAMALRDPPSQRDLAEIAAEVRLSRPRDVVAPFRLGPLPGGLRLSRTEVDPDGPATTLALTAARVPGTVSLTARPPIGEEKYAPLWVYAVPLPGGKLPVFPAGQKLQQFERYKMKAAPPVKGHKAWVADNDAYGQAKGYFKLIVDAGNCSLAFVTYDSRTMTPAQLRTIAEGTEYGDCENQSRWVSPVSR